MEAREGWLSASGVQKVREILSTVGSSQCEPVLLDEVRGRMLDLVSLGLNAITGESLFLQVMNELTCTYPVLRLTVISLASMRMTDQHLDPHEVGNQLDDLEQKLREAFGAERDESF